MKFVRIFAPLGAILALACAPAIAQAAGTSVTVRVEGKTRTLLPSKVVHLRSGWVTRNGAPKGACPAVSAAGALDQATHHRWGGSFSSSFSDYLIDTILGEKFSAKAKYYWEIFADNVMASTGACGIHPHRGEQLLFAAVPLADSGDYVVALRGVPHRAHAGHPFRVKVVYYDAAGKARPLAGAVVRGRGIASATADRHGVATITATHTGRMTLVATHADTRRHGHPYGYVRSAGARVTVTP